MSSGPIVLSDKDRDKLETLITGCWCDDGYVDVDAVIAFFATREAGQFTRAKGPRR